MKKNNGITLSILVITIVLMLIILGISINFGMEMTTNSRDTKYYTIMKLVKTKAQEDLEEKEFKNELISQEDLEWYKTKLEAEGISSELIEDDKNDYFIIVVEDYKVKNVLFYKNKSEECNLNDIGSKLSK